MIAKIARACGLPGGWDVKVYLIAPRNPESFWTFDRILPSLDKKCLFPNLSLPTVAGLTPREHEVVLCDENVEHVDLDTDADIIGLTGYVIHSKRIFELAAEFRRRGKFVVAGGTVRLAVPRAAPRQGRRALRRRGRVHVAAVPARLRGRSVGGRVPAGREADAARLAAAALRPAEDRPLPHDDDPVRARLPLPVRVLRHHRHVRPAAADQDGRAGHGRGAGDPPARARTASSSSTTTSSATRRRRRRPCTRSRTGRRRTTIRSS